MGLSSFGNDLVMPGAWGACMDVGGKFAGSLSGSMNMMGNFAGFLAPALLPWIREAAGGRWEPVFWVSGIIYLVGALSWVFIDPVTPLDRDEQPGIPTPG
jgi:ACS family glucarate transporter-like MFS transporter